jgi:single-stranded-DNA-specific exonuclease
MLEAPAPPRSRWVALHAESSFTDELLSSLEIEPATASILARRGIVDPSEAERFLRPSLDDLHDPSLMGGMEAAVARLRKALDDGETILIHGDFDVDGLASTALLARSLSCLGASVRTHIPHRLEEGYGLHEDVARVAAQAGATLVVSCDCGIRSHDVAQLLADQGIDLIITDHHEPGEDTPPAVAVLDPKLPGCPYPFKQLAGVGVVFKLGQALSDSLGIAPSKFQRAYLDLVALGTVADVVPLIGENRVLTTFGLQQLRRTQKVGLRALLRKLKLEDRPLEAYHVGFMIAPRMNAAGRLDDAKEALELLMTGSRSRADAIAKYLDETNSERQGVEATMLKQAYLRLAEDEDLLERDPVLVLAGHGWHRGVAGLVSGRIRERYGRPTFVLCIDERCAVGSARSVDEFDLARALDAVRDCLIKGGGHAMAAGVTLDRDRIGEFRARLNEYALQHISPADLAPVHKYDEELPAEGMTHQLCSEMQLLAPFGAGNPRPRFMTRGLAVEWVSAFGRESRHLRIGLTGGGRSLRAVAWRKGERQHEIQPGMTVDILYTLKTEARMGVVELVPTVDDFRPSAAREV